MEMSMISPKNTSAIVASLIACALAACGGTLRQEDEPTGNSAASLSHDRPPAVDPAIAVPAGNELAFALEGVGVQIYACNATASGYAWVFTAPEANLLNEHGKVVGKHFAGPTWEWLKDQSTVVGAKVAAVTVDTSAIPWLLLRAASNSGDGKMSRITFIQRLSTSGGNAPSSGCDASTVGAVARVGYTAKYYFFEATDDRGCEEGAHRR
jgi:hypothetical protein